MKILLLASLGLLIGTSVAVPNASRDLKRVPNYNIERTAVTNVFLQKRGCDMPKCLAAAAKLGFDCAKALIKEGKSLKDDIKCAVDIAKMIRKYKKHVCDGCIDELRKEIRQWRRQHRKKKTTVSRTQTPTFSGSFLYPSFSDPYYYYSDWPVTTTSSSSSTQSSPSPTISSTSSPTPSSAGPSPPNPTSPTPKTVGPKSPSPMTEGVD